MAKINPTEAALLAQRSLEVAGTPHVVAQATARIVYQQVERQNHENHNHQPDQYQKRGNVHALGHSGD